jgi:hypothetical protein
MSRYHQADVRVVAGRGISEVEQELRALCNDPTREEACVVFVETPLIWTSEFGAAMLLRVLQQPFVLITGDNIDQCVPYKWVRWLVCG